MIVAVLAAAATSAALCALFALTKAGNFLLDRPNERSLHDRPVPRIGGLGVFAGVLAGVAVLWVLESPTARPAAWLVAGALPLVLVGLLDDRFSLGAPVRFLVQAATTVALLVATHWIVESVSVAGTSWNLGILAWPLTTIAVMWAANLYNFMDGMDGFAGLMTAIGFGTLAALAAFAGHTDIVATAALPAAAALGFLLFNAPPARIFLGDNGSVPMGFLAAAISLWGVRRGAWSMVVPVIVFAPFAVDATVTLVRRLLRGERVWQAHREHVYQRLVLKGISKARVLALEAGFMMAASLLAVVAVRYPSWGTAVAFFSIVAIYAALAFAARPGPKASARF